MESSTPDPAAATPEPGVAPEPDAATPEVATPDAAVAQPRVPDLSLDESVAATPAAPDLDAVPTGAHDATPDSEQVNFDLWDSGSYATTLAQEGYGQPVPSLTDQPAPQPPAADHQQPGPTPYAQPSPYPSAEPYAQTPYGQSSYAQANPYQQENPYQQADPYAGQNPYAPVPYQGSQPGTLTPDEERTWASAAHWSALVASVVGLGFLGPLLVYLIQGPKSAWVKAQAAESLNFEITYIISMIASVIALLIVVGWVTIFVFPLLWLIFRIIATVATSQGRDYRYPVNIRMVK
jgi:uncharacterized Tic20 family protein